MVHDRKRFVGNAMLITIAVLAFLFILLVIEWPTGPEIGHWFTH